MASITSILREFPLVVLDGAFGTEIARRGFDTRDDLWAAKALFAKPELVKAVHRDYFEAGLRARGPDAPQRRRRGRSL